MKKISGLFIIIFINGISLITQAQNIHTMFWNSKSLFNPATSGVEHKYHAAFTGREQWAGFKNAPWHMGAILGMKSDLLHGGVGLNYMYTNLSDNFLYHHLNANYSYHINLGNERILSAGISGGIALMKYNFTFEDPLINEQGNETFYDFQFGVFYLSNHLQLGISSNHLEHSDLSSGKQITSLIYFYSSYRFDIGEILDFTPELFMIWPDFVTENLKFSSAIIFTIKERVWAGFTYGSNDIYGATVGVDIAGKVRLGYAFEQITVMNGNYGNHEFIMGLMIK